MTMNGLYSNLVNAQIKQEYSEVNEEDFLQSNDGIKNYELNDLDIPTIFDVSNTIPSSNQDKKRQISLKVKVNSLNFSI